MQQPIPIIIDCDPGHDDMVAIMLAHARPELELLGITTVAGNQTQEKTFLNARKITALIGAPHIAVARGCDEPLVRALVTAAFIHGESGLDGAPLPDPVNDGVGQHAVDFIIRTLEASPRPVVLVPTGPLTNIAMLLRLAPQIRPKIERIVLMGGAVLDSNVTPTAEFNIYVDPEAAAAVFASGLPITMLGLNVTNRALLSLEDIEQMSGWGGPISSIVAPLMRFFAGTVERFDGIRGATLHDALAVAAIFRPQIVRTEHLNVEIETVSSLSRGQTVVDLRRVTDRTPNADVALDLNSTEFRDLIMDAIKQIDNEV